MFTLKETAAILKADLRRTFPGVRFSVTSSGWAFTSITVRWTGGPSDRAVYAMARFYERSTFGGPNGQDRVDTPNTVQHADGRIGRPGADSVLLFAREAR